MSILKCWLTGHLYAYANHGPPIEDFGGAWYTCIRCGKYGRPGPFSRSKVVVRWEDAPVSIFSLE